MKTDLSDSDVSKTVVSRRQFVATSAAAVTAFTVVPCHVLGGTAEVAPSGKIHVALIGCGTQGLRELPDLLRMPEVRVVAVCDPVRDSQDFVDWSADGLRASLASALGQPEWRKGTPGIPGGREVAREYVQAWYARQPGGAPSRGCNAYADFRELLEKEKDLQAVKIMTPDHLHATIAVAALRKGRNVITHKPLANRLREARITIATARQTNLATHFLAASDGAEMRRIKEWIDADAIGTLREVHNWSNRPVWPQYPFRPTDRPPVPAGFDWDLWLGPSVDRPYHPHYTHAVFRGWYEFGGGALADMGHYSLWPVFQQLDLDAPTVVESRPSHLCQLQGNVAVQVRNDYSFPAACTVRFRFAAKGSRPALDLFWYDGGMRPPAPEELEVDRAEFEAEGMMFVGDRGRILANFLGANARLIPQKRMREFEAARGPTDQASRTQRRELAARSWAEAFKGGARSFGDFTLAGPISDAFNLAAVSLRLGGRRLQFDASTATVTNVPEANALLTRDYRKGWELA